MLNICPCIIKMNDVIIVAPSLDPKITLGGISSVASFIVKYNSDRHYIHFEQGKRDSMKSGLLRYFSLINNLNHWKKVLSQYPQSLVHYNFPLSPAAIIRDYIFMREARKRSRKMVIHVHGGLYMNTANIPFPLKWILKKIFSWNVPFIVLSDKEKEQLQCRFGAKDVHVLPNCVELDNHCITRNNNHNITLGYIGRITATKGMSELYEACRILIEKEFPFKLNIAGIEGDNEHYIDQFQTLLGNNFHYWGVVSGNEKKDFLRSLDVFVLPSYFEGLPMSLLEAMSYGALPVVTAVGSIPDVIKDGVNGILFKDHEVEPIVESVIKIANDANLRNSISNAARKTMVDNFSPQVYFGKLNSIYNSL